MAYVWRNLQEKQAIFTNKTIPKKLPGIQVSTPLKQLNNLSIYYYAFFLLRLLLGPCILGFVALGILGNSGPRISSVLLVPAQPSPAQPSLLSFPLFLRLKFKMR